MATSPDSANRADPARAPAPDVAAAIPGPAIKRLFLYLRELDGFLDAGVETISSRRLGESLGLTDAQVRKDLGYFGQFGQPGIGYEIRGLRAELRRVLGTDRGWAACLVGAGNLGRALLAHEGFRRKGFRLVAVFDDAPELAGRRIHGREVRPMSDLARVIASEGIVLGLVAVPAEAAQSVCDRLVAAGIRGLLNFAPKRVTVPAGVSVSSVDLAIQMEQLAFQVSLGRRLPAPDGGAGSGVDPTSES